MKAVKRIIGLILCLCLVFTTFSFAFASEEPTKYPYVLVHGMMGWGENVEGGNGGVYWGMLSDKPIAEFLREKGYEVAVPTVAPLGSAWDRACELYAQLTGTVVDYGKAHSEAYGHERYGRDYTGRALLGESGWDLQTPVNLVTHSFGGPTGTVFTSMLEYGVEEEIAASPDDCSELFRGGHAGLVRTVTTLESPHNGTQAANVINDAHLPLFIAALMMNLYGTQAQPGTDFMVDQFGITKDPSTGEKAKFSVAKCIALAHSNDHAGYDMTFRGAKELLERFPQPQGTYFFSVAANGTKENKLGMTVPADFNFKNILSFISPIVALLSALPVNAGNVPGKEWAANDGLVPVISAQYPFGRDHADYNENTELQKGVWYVLPVVEGANHGYGMSGSLEKLEGIWESITQRANNVK